MWFLMTNFVKIFVPTILISSIISLFSGLLGGYLIFEYLSDSNNVSDVISRDIEVINESSAIIDVADKTSPAVVSIVVTQEIENFFNGRTTNRQVGSGSGFIVSTDGLIVTNRHVVDEEDASYTVILNDGQSFQAEILARDTLLDIAFIQIDANDLPFLEFGSSENIQVGQSVVAIGNALGEFSNSVSSGIISGLGRDIIASSGDGFDGERIANVIQTDASINPGNSGGPLLDLDGNVIGVNVAVARDAENISFAIPVDDVRDLLERFSEEGEIARPILGVRYNMLNEISQEGLDLSVSDGAYIPIGDDGIPSIIPNSPAANAGLSEGDVIVAVDGVPLNQDNTLIQAIQSKRVGDEVEITINRVGDEFTVNVTLARQN